ncbi:MAG: GNAT family N-acetyltransferase [Saprospiraceae bacterium]|nr:GNAT family N-acetyltransferase [Saprospiraceae bacterium]
MNIRHAEPQDADAINAIYNQAVALGLATAEDQPVPVEAHRRWLQKVQPDRTPVLIADLDGRVAGYATLNDYRYGRSTVAHVREISYYVHNDLKRQGVATALYQACLGECALIGVTVLLTYVIADNVPSVTFLRRQGFAEWGRFPGIVRWRGKTYDHVVMGRHLASQSDTIL